ncbi:hypothetical protein CLV98_10925 [Dyadobacter jejuensis]|uniref:Uncharacterized protein n=1 Tax=Dyadobacter jejuensis TaxID=1082580 RepID=A0A316AGK5_9BACT|nr:hypothetical protein [Dyadobacter jejuensis]PWJ56916.1 hypothetical protein CLV98_10925 [Dyadobacter jejuensis]
MKTLLLFILLLCGTLSFAQVKIGSNPTMITPNVNLEVEATNGSKVVIKKDDGKVGIGTTAPDASLHVVGDVKIVDGNQGAGKVLTSDANGLASWQPLPAASSTQIAIQTAPVVYTTQSLSDIPGLSLPLLANKTYKIEYRGFRKGSTILSIYISYGNNTTDIAYINGLLSFAYTDAAEADGGNTLNHATVNKESLGGYNDNGQYTVTSMGAEQELSCILKTNTAQTLKIRGTNDKVGHPNQSIIFNSNSSFTITVSGGYLVATLLD